MKLWKIPLTFLMITLSINVAFAKKEPKYEKAHQLTPEQAALVEKAIAREKVIIKSIQQRTPLVETYIQEMRPDDKLYQVPTADTYMLNRVDFRKTFVDKPYSARSEKGHGFFKGSLAAFSNIGKALHLDKETFNDVGFTDMMFV